MNTRVNALAAAVLAVLSVAPRLAWASAEGDAAVASATLYNHTLTVSDRRCRELFGVAYDSLGFHYPEAIRAGDYLFCGRYYLAWIDNTGFPGEINGFWQLNGEDTDALDFVYGPDGLVRNMFIAAENRDGQWPDGYSGSIHLEILSHTQELGPPGHRIPVREQDLPCPFGENACNAYAINEAGNPTTPVWWSSCNGGSATFGTTFPYLTNVPSGESRKIVYENRLTKEADLWDPDQTDCDSRHADWMFEDQYRRPLYIRTGWELHGTSALLVNTYQVRNPDGNPPPGGHAYVIHGIVPTSLTDPPPGKEFRNWIMPSADHTAGEGTYCPVSNFIGGQFNYNGGDAVCESEKPFGADDIWVVSSVNGMQRGRTLATWHSNEEQLFEGDNQLCECFASGGFELNGGTVDRTAGIPTGEMFELPGGATTIEHDYNLALATRACRNSGKVVLTGAEDTVPNVDTLKYVATTDAPANVMSENPGYSGMWLIIRAADGEVLHKIRIPPGFGPGYYWYTRNLPGADTLHWTYTAVAAGATQGIQKVAITTTATKFSAKVIGKLGTYHVPFNRTPLRVELVFRDIPEEMDAACAETTFADCAQGSGGKLTCRRQRGDRQ